MIASPSPWHSSYLFLIALLTVKWRVRGELKDTVTDHHYIVPVNSENEPSFDETSLRTRSDRKAD